MTLLGWAPLRPAAAHSTLVLHGLSLSFPEFVALHYYHITPRPIKSSAVQPATAARWAMCSSSSTCPLICVFTSCNCGSHAGLGSRAAAILVAIPSLIVTPCLSLFFTNGSKNLPFVLLEDYEPDSDNCRFNEWLIIIPVSSKRRSVHIIIDVRLYIVTGGSTRVQAIILSSSRHNVGVAEPIRLSGKGCP
ncbi:hypothetical protein J6590_063247 [Homalodisca vitripennis]|nr:hypothetical protein J6590_063247 [Homalodisca vitripennis]